MTLIEVLIILVLALIVVLYLSLALYKTSVKRDPTPLEVMQDLVCKEVLANPDTWGDAYLPNEFKLKNITIYREYNFIDNKAVYHVTVGGYKIPVTRKMNKAIKRSRKLYAKNKEAKQETDLNNSMLKELNNYLRMD